MFTQKDSYLTPKVVLHRSHFHQLVIGGAMIDHGDPEFAQVHEVSPTNGSWKTRFDHGRDRSDLDCDLMAMYVEGSCYIYGYEGAYDMDVKVDPQCYALVLFRHRVKGELKQLPVYLRSPLSFASRITEDGFYDLGDAHYVAQHRGNIDQDTRFECSRELTFEDHSRRRDWRIVSKKWVPSHVRQHLHKAIEVVRMTIDSNFGQGKDFFALSSKKRK